MIKPRVDNDGLPPEIGERGKAEPLDARALLIAWVCGAMALVVTTASTMFALHALTGRMPAFNPKSYAWDDYLVIVSSFLAWIAAFLGGHRLARRRKRGFNILPPQA